MRLSRAEPRQKDRVDFVKCRDLKVSYQLSLLKCFVSGALKNQTMCKSSRVSEQIGRAVGMSAGIKNGSGEPRHHFKTCGSIVDISTD